ncbi:MAG TPA: symmetrical bis(5'-nucleosyl)-tetraphosphatase [Nitrospirales bacterium]
MAVYAVGDIQGCFSALQRLIDKFGFNPLQDTLWFVGDLVNRGPESLAVLRWVKALGPAAVVVLGNHDLHLLAAAEGVRPVRKEDTFQDVLKAPDREALLDWLRQQRLLYREKDFVLVHAGLLPQWTTAEAEALATEVEQVLRGAEYKTLLREMYGSSPARWSPELTGMARYRVIINALTRLRFCTLDGEMDFEENGPPETAPQGFSPWFAVPNRRSRDAVVISGHWAALGLRMEENLLALDSGCVWGQRLSAVRLEDRKLYQVSCGGG